MVSHNDMANALRFLAADAVEKAKSGHPGMPMGMADVATVLFRKFLKFDASHPDWPDRDRFVLSAGHGSMLLYGLLHLTGHEVVTLDEIKRFRQLGAITAGHPEYGHCQGVETTTGPLGQGLATAVGMALAERMLQARFGKALVDHKIYVIAGDGCLMEGISHEAIDLAGHLKLSNLVVLFDDNGISIDGAISLSTSMDQLARFEAAGWTTFRIDGHDPLAIEKALSDAQDAGKPVMIACRTTIGFGAPGKQGTAGVHGAPLGATELQAAREKLGWNHAAFEIPDKVRVAWREAGARGTVARVAWEERMSALDSATRQAFDAAISGHVSVDAFESLEKMRASFVAEKPRIATRQASELVISAITAADSNLIGGSADLTHSNLTKGKKQTHINATNFSGSYIHYGIREHAMGAVMNGIALHGGFTAYGGTFLVFSDYMRASIRLSALMGLPVIYVLTHDSIGLGEDGPTHQPVEHVASLRAMPNVRVFRPADAVETADAWRAALEHRTGPTLLCLSRQALPTLDVSGASEAAKGAYVVRGSAMKRNLTILATGSEVSLAVSAADELEARGFSVTVVSMPCWESFRLQPQSYRNEVLGSALRIGVEALSSFGWHEWIGEHGIFIGMKGFGASAPADQLFNHFGITKDAIVSAALNWEV